MTHTLRRRLGTSLLTTVALAALPAAPALGGTAGLVDMQAANGGTVRALLFVADPGEANSTELFYEAGAVTVADGLAGGVRAGDGCVEIVTAGSRDVRCALEGVEIAVLALGDGNDVQRVPDLGRVQRACPLPLYVDGGDGDDVIVTCRDADTAVDLGAGRDRLHVGTTGAVDARLGPGDDVVASFNGAQVAREAAYDGGPGDDVLVGTAARETFTGGEGHDRVEFPFNRVEASLDGRPGDSPEGDHVLGDVEELAASVAGSVLSGSDGPDVLVSGGPGVTLRGLGGDDVLVGSDHGERLEGGPGSDRITAGFGDDDIDPGPGADTVDADRQAEDGFAAGNDTVRARDGELDRIGCGVGADVAEVDAGDVTEACERVDRVAASASGTPGSAPPPVVPARPAIRALAIQRTTLGRALRSGLGVRITSTLTARTTVEARLAGRVVGRGTARIRADRPALVRVRFTGAGRRLLAGRRHAALRLTVTTAGGARRTVTAVLRG